MDDEFKVGDIVVSIGYTGKYVVEAATKRFCRLRYTVDNRRLTLSRRYMAKQWVRVDGRDD